MTVNQDLLDTLERLSTQLGSPSKSTAEKWATPAAVLVSAMGLAFTIIFSNNQLTQQSEQFEAQMKTSSDQFELSTRRGQYTDIVNGLESSSVAVQTNSIRRLVQYVTVAENFDNDEQQNQAATNAAQTLAAFIQDESVTPGREGLSNYRDPQPVVISRAFDESVDLINSDASSPSLDLSGGNFHGIDAVDLIPRGTFRAASADFRLARATGWDLSEANNVDLQNSFFTCANLQESSFGAANLDGADLTGANLRGADLSKTQNLTSAQIGGALTGEKTQLPPDVVPPDSSWGVQQSGEVFNATAACTSLAENMSRLVGGAGYSSRLACPGNPDSPYSPPLAPAEWEAIKKVCEMRANLSAK